MAGSQTRPSTWRAVDLEPILYLSLGNRPVHPMPGRPIREGPRWGQFALADLNRASLIGSSLNASVCN